MVKLFGKGTYQLGYDRQDFQLNSVELIEAGPGPSTSQALKKLAHSQVIQSVRAVEDNTLHCQSLGQILHSFSLSCACRALRGSAQVQVEGTHQRTVAAVSQGRDHQPTHTHTHTHTHTQPGRPHLETWYRVVQIHTGWPCWQRECNHCTNLPVLPRYSY